MNDSNFQQQLPAQVAIVPRESTNPAAIALVKAQRPGNGDKPQTIEIIAHPLRARASAWAIACPQQCPSLADQRTSPHE